MSIKRQISEIQGIQDPKVAEILGQIKAIIEGATGRAPNKKAIVKLGANANSSGMLNKINEIITQLQEG